MTFRQILLTIALISLVAPLSVRADGVIRGVTSGYTPGTAPYVQFDPATGACTVLATVGHAFNALAQDPEGRLYAGTSAAPNQVVDRLDVNTGAVLETHATNLDIRGLAFNSAGVLYAAVNVDDEHGAPTLPDDLYTVNLSDNTSTRIGSFGTFTGVQGLDFNPVTGGLYAWDAGLGLLTVDPATGLATDVNTNINGTADIQSIVFGPNGELFGARADLYSINPVSGAYTQIGSGIGLDVRGIEWIDPTAVPEPASVALLGLGGLVLLRRGGRQVRSGGA